MLQIEDLAHFPTETVVIFSKKFSLECSRGQ
nr:MAG TPA: hypothetical protein [Caudoviricetes sp.]